MSQFNELRVRRTLSLGARGARKRREIRALDERSGGGTSAARRSMDAAEMTNLLYTIF